MLPRALVALCLAGAARADGPEQHRGFYLRMTGGYGGIDFRGEDERTSSGAAGHGAGGIAIGGAVAEDLILYGDFFFQYVSDSSSDLAASSGLTRREVSGTLGMLSFGVARYFMPANVWFAGQAGVADVTFKHYEWEGGGGTLSDFVRNLFERRRARGFGASVIVGKEWWISDQWGMGVAAEAFGASLNETDVEHPVHWRALGASLLLSATYN